MVTSAEPKSFRAKNRHFCQRNCKGYRISPVSMRGTVSLWLLVSRPTFLFSHFFFFWFELSVEIPLAQ